MSKLNSDRKGNKMIVKRTFNAPRDLVFEVHSNCEHLMNWYGGEEWPLSKCEIDFRVGGRWQYCFKMPDLEACALAIFDEIKRPEKIVYKEHFLDENGEYSDEMPVGVITLEFIEEGEKTTIVNCWEYPSERDLDMMLEMGAIDGLTEVWNRLNDYLKQHKSKG